MPTRPDKEAEKLRQAELRLANRMAEDQAKATEKIRQDTIRAAQKLRQAEIRLAARMAEDAAKEAEHLAKAEEKAAARLARAKAREAREARRHWRKQPIQRGIKIDLLAEAREAAEWRRKHPLKRTAWICGFSICVMLLWLLELHLALNLNQMKIRNLEKRYGVVRRRVSLSKDAVTKSVEINKRLTALDRLETNRFLWAPLLNSLQKTMIDDIQVTRLTGRQSYTSEAAHSFTLGSRKIEAPGDIVEHISLFIEAKDMSPDELSYIKYKESLGNCEYFSQNLRSREGFILEGVLKPTAPGKLDRSNEFSKFVLSAHFPEVRRRQ
jgi:hypothetical protein